MRTKTVNELQRAIDAFHGVGIYKLVERRQDLGRGKALVLCSKHGKYIGQIPTKHITCKKCHDDIRGKTKLSNRFEKFKAALSTKFLGQLRYIRGYQGSKTRCTIECRKHGLKEVYPGAILKQEFPCLECRSTNLQSKTLNRKRKEFEAVCRNFPGFSFGDFVSFSRDKKRFIKVLCKKHKRVFKIADCVLKKSKVLFQCPDCLREHRQKTFTKTHDDVVRELTDIHKGSIELLDPYTGTREVHKFKCLKCKHTWKTIPDSLVRTKHSGCPHCNKTVSEGECALFSWIRTLCPDAKQSVRKAYSLKLGYKFEWDIYIPSRKIAIEFNGLFYHSYPKKPKWYHSEKTKRSSDLGVKLIHVYEDDWKYRRRTVEKTLKHLIGIVDVRYYARELRVSSKSSIDNTIRNFYNRNHMLGAPIRGTTYALLNGNRPLALMTFTKIQSHRGVKDDGYELTRFASVGQIVGGASRLLTAFKRDFDPGRIVSYSDTDMFDGNLYTVLGFMKVGELKYDYTTVWGKRRRHKSYTRRSNLEKLLGSNFDESESEMQNLVRNKKLILFNSGRIKWEWKNERPSVGTPAFVSAIGPHVYDVRSF